MFSALSLPDLDALDPAALKAMILAQHDQYQDHFKAQHEKYTATLTSRASEIERLALLVKKLQRMLFGAKSEKVLRQIEQLSSSLKICRQPVPLRRRRRFLPQSVPHQRSPSAAPCRSIFRAKSTLTCPAMRPAPTAVEGCAS